MVAPADASEQMIRKLRGKNEFTVLVTLKQEHLNSGVILSIHHSEHRFESNALRGNIASVCFFFTSAVCVKTEIFGLDERSDVNSRQ